MQQITRHFRWQYYLHDGTFEHGPYTLEELRTKNLSLTSLIWHSRLKEWTKVAEVAEVATLINLPPPTQGTDPASSPAATFNFAYESSPGREDAGTAKSYGSFVVVGGIVLIVAVVVLLFGISC